MPTPIAQATEAVQEFFHSFTPTTVADARSLFSELPEFLTETAKAIAAAAARIESDTPIAKAIAEHMHDLASGVAGLGDRATELRGMFERVHETELRRVDEPRPGEEMFDVTRQ